MTHRFDTTPSANIPRSSFDRTSGYKTTFDAGLLIPFFVDEALPGDTFNLKLTAFARLATPIKPIMDNMYMETFFFSVPVRQIWENWERFNGEQDNPQDSTDFLVPITNLIGTVDNVEGSLWDYMGIPVGVDISVNSLHSRAYNHIYNNWFRDQNLKARAPFTVLDGPDTAANHVVLRRRKRPDYFTSCLPFPQKGADVTVPIADRAEVKIDTVATAGPNITAVTDTGFQSDMKTAGSELTLGTQDLTGYALYADLAGATGITINDLRESFQVQKLLERDARGGSRYPEIIKSHFGVTDPQMLVLQRPEFLGGGSSRINISPVQQTSKTDTGTDPSAQGNLAGFGTVSLMGHGFTKSFTEHCVIIGIVNVRADLTYQQGLNRMWSRRTRFDYYWPALSHLGEQSVLNKEIFADGSANDELVFGYQERYAEYRYKPSLITGKFRSVDPASLDVWHLSEEFGSVPLLGSPFIDDNPPVDRVIAVQSEPHFLFDAYIDLRCVRPMPLYGVPGLIDHF